MIDFIPVEYYTDIYYNIILLVVVFTWVHTKSFSGFTKDTYRFSKISGIILFWFVLLYMGLRPVSWYFGDMTTYARYYDIYASGEELDKTKDVGFYTLMKVLSSFQSTSLFFFVITLLYILPLYIATKRLFKKYYYFAFLILVAAFSFWTYGTNGLRNGLATSFIILAFSYMNKKWLMYLLFVIAYSFHSSVLLPIAAYFVTSFYRSSGFYFKIWVLSIFLSLAVGSSIENFITALGIMDDEAMDYFTKKDAFSDSFSNTGFRWDFLIYSAFAVGISYYFIFVKKIKDKYYTQLTNIYLLSNAFWILVIKASFSNRFAYLSWFLMGIIIIYPFLQQVHFKKQFSIMGSLTFLYFMFTYFMNFILPNI